MSKQKAKQNSNKNKTIKKETNKTYNVNKIEKTGKKINNKKKTNKKVSNSKKKTIKKIKNNGIKIFNINPKLLMVIIFFTGVLLIFSSYAWFSSSLNVKIKFFDLVVSSDDGLFISLDGLNFSDSVEISTDSLITNLKTTYPNNTNQWASGGLWPVSSNGIKNVNSNKFDVYVGEVAKLNKHDRDSKKILNARLIKEDSSNAANSYIAFDLFLKNITGSPNKDNLYFDDDTKIDFDYEKYEESNDVLSDDVKDAMSGIMNSMRIGIVKIGSAPLNSDVRTIQNIGCNNNCQMIIYEPNSTAHSSKSIDDAKTYGVTLVDGQYVPTYAVINEGDKLQHASGQEGTGLSLDTEHFALQNTIKNFDKPIFEIPRLYQIEDLCLDRRTRYR